MLPGPERRSRNLNPGSREAAVQSSGNSFLSSTNNLRIASTNPPPQITGPGKQAPRLPPIMQHRRGVCRGTGFDETVF